MKIIPVQGSGRIYSSNVYLVLGDWNRIEDINTLVDVGSDPAILDRLEEMHTGVGKKKVEQVVLTHSHSDHTAMLPLIRERYKPTVFCIFSLSGRGGPCPQARATTADGRQRI